MLGRMVWKRNLFCELLEEDCSMGIKSFFKKLNPFKPLSGRSFPLDLQDAMIIVSLAFIGYGFWTFRPGLGFISVGALLFLMASKMLKVR